MRIRMNVLEVFPRSIKCDAWVTNNVLQCVYKVLFMVGYTTNDNRHIRVVK